MRRVVITGVGAVSPCGLTAKDSWENVVAGKSGIAPITGFDATDFASRIAGECTGFDPEVYIEKKRVREMARFIHLAMGAAQQAMESSGLEPNDEQKDRIGTFVGVGFCGLEYLEHTVLTW